MSAPRRTVNQPGVFLPQPKERLAGREKWLFFNNLRKVGGGAPNWFFGPGTEV